MPWNKSTKVSEKDKNKWFRINWTELEFEFVVSWSKTVTEFLKQKFPTFQDSTINSYIKHNAYNWVKRKKEFRLNHLIQPYISDLTKIKYVNILTDFMYCTLTLSKKYFAWVDNRDIEYKEFLDILKFQKEVMWLNMWMEWENESQVIINIQKIENLSIN